MTPKQLASEKAFCALAGADLLARLTEFNSALYVGCNVKRFTGLPTLIDLGLEVTILEIWEPYVNEILKAGYPFSKAALQWGDLRDFAGFYDVILWRSGPEHMDKNEAIQQIQKFIRQATLLIIDCPWGIWPQKMVDGNPTQEHKSYWYPEDFHRFRMTVKTSGAPDEKVGGMGRILAYT